jgi:hypothetical protein
MKHIYSVIFFISLILHADTYDKIHKVGDWCAIFGTSLVIIGSCGAYIQKQYIDYLKKANDYPDRGSVVRYDTDSYSSEEISDTIGDYVPPLDIASNNTFRLSNKKAWRRTIKRAFSDGMTFIAGFDIKENDDCNESIEELPSSSPEKVEHLSPVDFSKHQAVLRIWQKGQRIGIIIFVVGGFILGAHKITKKEVVKKYL